MKINAVKLRIATAQGDFGFLVEFSRHLTIIRGNNSSGKSTLFLCLLYGLGMEELAGGRNESILPYAVKEHFNYEGKDVEVIASEVFVEIENASGESVTLHRAIRDNVKSPKLIDVLSGKHLTDKPQDYSIQSTFIHDAGAAQIDEGFHKFLERFLGLELPHVPSTTGGETKLYIQAVFAALAVEQKRGWTDYIANIPYFGIRDARTRVVEYLLDLDVFETNAERNRLNSDSVVIANSWEATFTELRRRLLEVGAMAEGIPLKVSALFNAKQVNVKKRSDVATQTLPEYVESLRLRHAGLTQSLNKGNDKTNESIQNQLNSTTAELSRLTHLFESTSSSLALKNASIKEYEQLYEEAERDLARNKTALKLRKLGSTLEEGLSLAEDKCPTCHQQVDDSLLMEVSPGPQMDLDANINYLDKQSRMLDRQIAGTRKSAQETEATLAELSRRIQVLRIKLNSLRSDITTDASQSRTVVREQIQIEVEIERIQSADEAIEQLLIKLDSIAVRLKENQASRLGLPKSYYSEEDLRKIRVFEKFFRANAGTFEYESARIDDIKINDEALVPYLLNTELRGINLTPSRKNEIRAKSPSGADIKADSSASDFVRLILSYLLALYQSSSLPGGGGRHPGILMFDEPGQHSMGQSSQRALLKELASNNHLQGIVAASFDESPNVFKEVTEGIEFKLVELDGKSIRPLTR